MKKTFLAFVSLLSIENMEASNAMPASVSKTNLSQALVQKIQYANTPEEALVEVQSFLGDEGEVARKRAVVARLQDGQALLTALRLEPRNIPLVKLLIDNGPIIDNSSPLKLADKICTYDMSLMKTPKSFKLSEFVADSCRSVHCGSGAGAIADMLKKRMKLYNSGNQELITMDDKEIVDELDAVLEKAKKEVSDIVQLRQAFLAKQEKIGTQPEVVDASSTENAGITVVQKDAVPGKAFSITSVALGIAIGGTAVVLASKALAAQTN